MSRALTTKSVEYYVGQPVLVWQPQQNAYTHSAEDGSSEEAILEASPQKWTPRWTGPHAILKKQGINTYDIVHGSSDHRLRW